MKSATARDIMNPRVMAVPDDMTVSELAEFLTERQITGAPVVDRSGRPVGVVSVTDIAEAHAEAAGLTDDRSNPEFFVRGWEDELDAEEMRSFHLENGEALVRDLMTPTIFAVPEDTPAAKIAKTMIAGRIHRLLVTREGRIVGIVTSLDVLKLVCDDA